MKIPAGSLSSGKSNLSNTSFMARAENFRSQVELYKQLALNSPMEVPKKDQDEHKKDLDFLRKELGKILDEEILDFSNEDFQNPDQYFYQRVAALTTFMYLFDKLLELGEAVNRKKTVGIYSIYDEVMAGLFGLLSVHFFVRPLNEVIRDYLEVEPILVACAELTERDLEPIQDAGDLYEKKLTERVEKIIEPAKASKKKSSKKETRKTKKKAAKKSRKKTSRKSSKGKSAAKKAKKKSTKKSRKK